ncbi:MAG: tRNA preQ1(34) S-adenosylmethionine ribosyltransferase-isomerase QueA [Planctomycetota bacterium]
MRTDDFDFDLPPDRIAQQPVTPRDAARLLVRRASDEGALVHGHVRDLPDLLREGDLLVVNDTRVLAARVLARRTTRGRVELLLLEPDGQRPGSGAWRAMVRPAKKLAPGEVLVCAEGIVARMIERDPRDGLWSVELSAGSARADLRGASVEELLQVAGAVPLPPYIERAPSEVDEERYQTVYARVPGAVAAPTAGLHFTETLFATLEERGVAVASVTLHVGPGTFAPVTAESIEDHAMHSERFELGRAAVDAVRRCRTSGGRVVAVGTTSARVLESCAVDEPGFDRALVDERSGSTDIFLHPGRPPRVCDGILTNFHLPRSTLVMLVAAFIGREETLAMYRAAIEEGYRFYSYGDATLLLP